MCLAMLNSQYMLSIMKWRNFIVPPLELFSISPMEIPHLGHFCKHTRLAARVKNISPSLTPETLVMRDKMKKGEVSWG